MTNGAADAEDERPFARVAAIVGWGLFVLVLTWVLFYGGSYAGINFTPLRTVNLEIIAIGMVVWGVLAWRDPAWRPRTAIWPALMVPFGALVLATLASPHPRLGLDYLLWAILLIGLYLLLVRVLARPFVRIRLGPVLALSSLVMSGAYIANVVIHWLEWWQLIGRLSAPMLRPAYTSLPIGGPTIVAPVLVLLAVSGTAAIGFSTPRRRVTVAAMVLLTLVAVLLSGTRAAWLGLAVASAVVGVGWLMVNRSRIGRLVVDRRVRAGLAVILVAMLAVALLMAPALMDRITGGGDGGRAVYLATALRMFEASPLLGQGPGGWAALQQSFLEPGELRIYLAHAHGPYGQTLAESGVVGIIAGAIALAALLWLITTALRGHDAVRRSWAVAALFVLAYLAASFLFDSYWNLPLLMLLGGLPFAYLDATSPGGITDAWWRPDARTARRVHVAASLATFALCAAAVVGLLRIESIAGTHLNAAGAINERDWETAVPLAAAAVRDDPDLPPYQVTYGIASAGIGDWSAAEAAFEAAATTDHLPESWLGLALARLENGRPADQVLAAVERARAISDDSPAILMAAASLYDRLDVTAAADDAYATVLTRLPSLAADGEWWSTTTPRFDALVDLALGRATGSWELALMAGDLPLARAEAANDAFAALVIDAWSGDTAALDDLRDAALGAPTNLTRVSWAARASANAGDREAAARFRRIVDFSNDGFGRVGYEARVLDQANARPAGAVEATHRYGREAYRRWTPEVLMAPGLPTIVYVDLSTTADEGD